MRRAQEVFRTSLLHSADGFVNLPYQFQDPGTYHVMVEVDGILFVPSSETADFLVNVRS
ncbi:MAG: hypothetical protein KGI02_05440 [Thaumarchaeota archaeon]|nr:hypothetical protein [Nitrososphaerota archaeon]MDE1877454.1 hypothetical protein [Nitrososphaerota archaeon]